MVYRLLLIHDDVIMAQFRLCLRPAILRTCRQVLLEARHLLYEGNTWGMTIFDKGGQERAYFWGSDHFGEYPSHKYGFRVEVVRRLRITVEIHGEDNLWAVRSAIRKVCRVLSDIPQLDYVHLSLEGGGGTEAPEHCHVLKNFGLLRRVGKVTTAGVPRVYAEYLRRRMTGCAPLDNLPKMYEALELYAGPFDFSAALLQKAIEAVELGNVQQFKDLRARIVEQVDGHMKESVGRLYDHDGQGEDHGPDNMSTPEVFSGESTDSLMDSEKDE